MRCDGTDFTLTGVCDFQQLAAALGLVRFVLFLLWWRVWRRHVVVVP